MSAHDEERAVPDEGAASPRPKFYPADGDFFPRRTPPRVPEPDPEPAPLPALLSLVDVTDRLPVPFGCPHDGWRVIGHLARGRVTIARNGRRINVFAHQISESKS